ncbi:MAG: tetratricopeptide repeat protein [Actinobacteria bacterium]|nr:tetratricopeptide repeat protein [Actinomycetota bacterium]
MTAETAALARARSLVAIQRWREAIDVLAPALGNEATAADAHCLRAQCLLALQQPGPAAAAARQALTTRPDSEWAHRLLGVAYLRTHRHRAAHTEAAEAVRLAPGSVHALHLLAVCQLAGRRWTSAEQTARMAVAAAPQDPLAHLTVAQVAVRQRQWAEAERAYREGLRLAPDDPDLALGLGHLLHRLGRRDEAAQAYLAAGRSNPTDSRSRHALARLGLPAVGAGTVLAVKVGLVIGAQHLIHLRPGVAAVVVGGFLLVAGGVTAALRIRGTRTLPEAVRQGLQADHRNAALRWLQIAAVVAVLLAIWSAALPTTSGGGFGEAAGFAAFAGVAWYVTHRFWTGPRRSLTEAARTFGTRLTPWRR